MGKLIPKRMHKARVISIPTTTLSDTTGNDAVLATLAEVKFWKGLIEAEINTLEHKCTWSDVKNKPTDTHAPPAHIVLKIKINNHGQLNNFKARLAAGSYRQVYPREYDKIYVPGCGFHTLSSGHTFGSAHAMVFKTRWYEGIILQW